MKYLEVFYFIQDTQKTSILRVCHSNNKMYFYAQVSNSTGTHFTRVSKEEYNLINDHWSCIKDSFVTYFKNGKLYNEHCLRFN